MDRCLEALSPWHGQEPCQVMDEMIDCVPCDMLLACMCLNYEDSLTWVESGSRLPRGLLRVPPTDNA